VEQLKKIMEKGQSEQLIFSHNSNHESVDYKSAVVAFSVTYS
jgi:hypothetical protein